MARLLLGGDAASTIDTVLSWECAVLFMGFVLITLAWEFGTALLAYLTVRLSGRKAIWLQRIKGEILALGIITLVLTVITSSLETICISTSAYSSSSSRRRLLAGGSAVECPDGTRQLFPYVLIHDTHMLLFTAAIVHIVASCTSFYLSLARMRLWRGWEKNARTAYELQLEEAEVLKQLGGSTLSHVLRSVRNAFTSAVTEPLYNLLRILFKIRIDDTVAASGRPQDQLPANFSFLNVVEQAMEVDFSQGTDSLTIVLFIFMAIFLVIPRTAHGIYFLSLTSIITTLIISAKYQSVVVQLASCTLFDFTDEIKAIQVNKRKSVARVATSKATFKGIPHSGTSSKFFGVSGRASMSPRNSLSGGIFQAPSSRHPRPSLGAVAEAAEERDLEQGAATSATPATAATATGRWMSPGLSFGLSSSNKVAPERLTPPGGPAAGQLLNSPGGAASGQLLASPGGAAKGRRVSFGDAEGERGCDTAAEMEKRDKLITSMMAELQGYRSRVSFHFRDPSDPSKLRSNCYDLFWFRRPKLLYFLFELAWCESSIALTLLFFALVQDGPPFAEEDGIWLVTLTVVANIAILTYSALLVHPVAALVNTAGTDNPARLVREIKKSKLVEEEEYEEGVGGAFIRWCFGAGQEDEELLIKHMPFILMLADQAGVIASAKQHHGDTHDSMRLEVFELYDRFTQVWVEEALRHRRGEERGDRKYPVHCNLSAIYEGFCLIDTNHSGTISSGELAAVLKAMGTRATAEELEDMVDEIDLNGTDSIDFTEFCLFLIFKFFDVDKDGYIDRLDCEATLKSMGLECSPEKAEQLMDVCLANRDTKRNKDPRRLVHLSEFIRQFSEITDLQHLAPAEADMEGAAAAASERAAAGAAATTHH